MCAKVHLGLHCTLVLFGHSDEEPDVNVVDTEGKCMVDPGFHFRHCVVAAPSESADTRTAGLGRECNTRACVGGGHASEDGIRCEPVLFVADRFQPDGCNLVQEMVDRKSTR